MQDIRDLKTRDESILKQTLNDMMGHHINPIGETSLLLKAVEKIPCDTYLIYSNELKQWIFTNILDDELVYQEYFKDINFVIVERDINMALARGIHYRYHKKVRP